MAKGGSGYDPYEHAERLGVQLVPGRLRASNALWVPEKRMIILQPRMKVIQERSVLAHELGHVELGHRDDRPKHEVLADRFAAENLVDPDRLLELIDWAPNTAHLSLELGVTTKLMQVYLNVHRGELAKHRSRLAS
jgi:Zn-dependent peptidase ImmA (M78 family)